MPRMGKLGKIGVGIAGIVLTLLLIVVIAAALLQDRVRALTEQEINRRAGNYEVRIAKLSLHPLRLAVELHDVLVRDKRHPDPALLELPQGTIGVWWSGLLRGRVMGEVVLDGPRAVLDQPQRAQVGRDVKKHAPSMEEQQAWQDKILGLMPVAVSIALRDGTVTYREQGRPVATLSHLSVLAGPIRNEAVEQGRYPASIRLSGRINESADIELQGGLNAFAKPHPAGKAHVALHHLALAPLQPLADHYHVKFYQGQVSFDGDVEYAPWRKEYTLHDVTLEQVRTNYIYQPEAHKPEQHAAKKGAQKTKEAAEEPETVIRAEHVKIADSEFGVVHVGVDPPYRVFVDQAFADLKNFSTDLREKAAELTVKGRFMASGALDARGLFRPDPRAPDFDVSIKLEHAQVKMLNDLLQAHGHIDVAGGEFFVYSQFNVQHGQIKGYVKPIIRNLDVYDPGQERGKGVVQKVYEGVVGGTTELLQNRESEEAGTQVEVSGTLKNTQLDAWQAAMRLIQNAFFQLIVPRFERPVRPATKAVLTVE